MGGERHGGRPFISALALWPSIEVNCSCTALIDINSTHPITLQILSFRNKQLYLTQVSVLSVSLSDAQWIPASFTT